MRPDSRRSALERHLEKRKATAQTVAPELVTGTVSYESCQAEDWQDFSLCVNAAVGA